MAENLLKCVLSTDKNDYNSEINNADRDSSLIFEGIKLEFKRSLNIVNCVITNETDNIITLNKLEIQLFTDKVLDYEAHLINSEDPKEAIKIKSMERPKDKSESNSFLFGVFIARERFNNKIAGFLSAHSSRNSIKSLINGDNIEIYAVYDFFHHKLDCGESLILDGVYFDLGNSHLQLISKYASTIKSNHSIKWKHVESIQRN